VAGLDLTTDRVAGVAAVRARFADRAAVLVETTMLRARAQVKLPGTGTWLFTDDALQQATAAPVAAHRARRLTGQRVHDATCSIGTELAALHAHGVWALGSDIDDVRLSMAQHNLDGRVPLCRADALAPVSRDTVVLLDPARRSAGVRRFDPRAYTPPLDDIATVYAGRPIIVKCAPGIDFDAVRALGFDGEIEVVSLGGSVREACLWPAVLCEPGVRRRAVVLSRGEQFTDADPDDCPVAPAGPPRWPWGTRRPCRPWMRSCRGRPWRRARQAAPPLLALLGCLACPARRRHPCRQVRLGAPAFRRSQAVLALPVGQEDPQALETLARPATKQKKSNV